MNDRLLRHIARTAFVVARKHNLKNLPLPAKGQNKEEFIMDLSTFIRHPELQYANKPHPGSKVQFMERGTLEHGVELFYLSKISNAFKNE